MNEIYNMIGLIMKHGNFNTLTLQKTTCRDISLRKLLEILTKALTGKAIPWSNLDINFNMQHHFTTKLMLGYTIFW